MSSRVTINIIFFHYIRLLTDAFLGVCVPTHSIAHMCKPEDSLPESASPVTMWAPCRELKFSGSTASAFIS